MAKAKTDDVIKDIEEQAKHIAKKMKLLQNDCLDSMNRRSIPMKHIFFVMAHMEKLLVGKDGELFQESFIGHLKIVAILAEEALNDNFYENFKKITRLLFQLFPKIVNNTEFLCRVFRVWCSSVQHIPHEIIQEMTNEDQLKTFGQSIVSANTISLQQTFVDTIFHYFGHTPETPSQFLRKFFQEMSSRKIDIGSVTNDFAEKQWFLYQLNRHLRPNDQKIHSEMVECFAFGDEVVRCDTVERFVHFNVNSIEFWVPYGFDGSDNIKVHIHASNIKKVVIQDDDLPFARVMAIELNREAKFEDAKGRQVAPDKLYQANVITMEFMVGFKKSQLNELLLGMLCITADRLIDFLEKRAKLFPFSDTEIYDDDDSIEFISLNSGTPASHNRSQSKSSQISEKPTQSQEIPIKPSKSQEISNRPSHDIFIDPNESFVTPSEIVMEKMVKSEKIRPKRKFDSPVTKVDLTDDNEPPPKTMKSADVQIEPSTFYRSSIDDTKTQLKRPKRGAAKVALKKIKTVDTYKFSDDSRTPPKKAQPKKKKRAPTKRKAKVPIGPVIEIPPRIGNSINPRKLYNPNQYDDDASNAIDLDVDKKQKIRSHWSNEPVIPESFHSSILEDTNRKKSRIFQNIDKINLKAQNRPNASFSYRQSKIAQKQQPADSTIVSIDAAKGSQNDHMDIEDDDIDVNGNFTANVNIDRKGTVGRCTKDCNDLNREFLRGVREISNISNQLVVLLSPK
ncbi:uncharacterized protein LOC116350412 [Contarinia nasturtii]|uniref:uncharacterized protein LOC116350412 n=1 Tax=Contarinia nasturtii TaxID=265458 RepID=UPI0012D4B7AE|nr:uncharacterized protein LOC116350412 [Contarinia nasturtii]